MSVASEAMSGIRMIVAYGAESRIGNKYGKFVEEAKKHAQFAGPFIALQYGLVVCPKQPFCTAIC
jgi:hypothetical protein